MVPVAKAGQVVRVPPLAKSDMKPAEARPVKISDADAKMIRDCVVYKDDDVLVINKPAGLAVPGLAYNFSLKVGDIFIVSCISRLAYSLACQYLRSNCITVHFKSTSLRQAYK